ncbi:AI-2E family transporter [Paracidovorax citrulli]
MRSGRLIEQLAAVLALVVLIGGTALVLAPFMTALLWGAILAFSSWRPYMRLTRLLHGRRVLAALICVVVSAVVLLGPFFYGAISLTGRLGDLADLGGFLDARNLATLRVPGWIAQLPVIGERIVQAWQALVTSEAAVWERLRQLVAPVGHLLLAAGITIGSGLGQMALSVILAFFFYTQGEAALAWLHAGMQRIVGEQTDHLLSLVASTVRGVVYGVIGTAFAQGVLAGIGFWIAGVPSAGLLGFVTFFVSILPLGPPLVWIPVAIWLAHAGMGGWAIFIVAWGILVVGLSEQILKPLLIGKGTEMPLLWVMLGIIGGAMAFGLLGVFVGPTILAIAYALLRDWSLGTAGEDARPRIDAPRSRRRRSEMAPLG